DYGQSWQEIVSGIGEKDFTRSAREDPVRKGLLYAGTEKGVYVSFDDGDHWQSLRLNMPMVSIHDLAIEQDDLVAATYGRSFWILDDVTPLRQVDAGMTSAGAHLFAPRTAIRVRRDENQDTPLPPAVHVQSPYNYPIAAIAGSTPLPPEGPLALPGKYEVQLKAGGQILRQPLEVKMDPRVNAPRNELESALELQLKISAVLGRNHEAYQQVKHVRTRLAELMKRPKGDPVATAAMALNAKATTRAGAHEQSS